MIFFGFTNHTVTIIKIFIIGIFVIFSAGFFKPLIIA